MELTPAFYLLTLMFASLALVFLANSMIVPNGKYMRLSILLTGLGFLNLFFFYIGRGIGLIGGPNQIASDVFRWSLILLGIGLLSVGGVPLLEEILKRTHQWRNIK